jgi:hypothetical protein
MRRPTGSSMSYFFSRGIASWHAHPIVYDMEQNGNSLLYLAHETLPTSDA